MTALNLTNVIAGRRVSAEGSASRGIVRVAVDGLPSELPVSPDDLDPSRAELIEMGVDILNPVQTSAQGMDAVRLKNEFGDRLTFWGASLDCQQTLPFGSAEEVAREVEQHVKVCKPGGGYVFAPVHNIQAGVPPENLLAMFDTALSVGSYD